MLTFLPFSLEYIGDEYDYDGMEDENDKTIFKAMNRLLMWCWLSDHKILMMILLQWRDRCHQGRSCEGWYEEFQASHPLSTSPPNHDDDDDDDNDDHDDDGFGDDNDDVGILGQHHHLDHHHHQDNKGEVDDDNDECHDVDNDACPFNIMHHQNDFHDIDEMKDSDENNWKDRMVTFSRRPWVFSAMQV